MGAVTAFNQSGGTGLRRIEPGEKQSEGSIEVGANEGGGNTSISGDQAIGLPPDLQRSNTVSAEDLLPDLPLNRSVVKRTASGILPANEGETIGRTGRSKEECVIKLEAYRFHNPKGEVRKSR